jgi:hypothetical protein
MKPPVRRVALGLALLASVLPAEAFADVVTRRDTDGVASDVAERLALTAAERRALDIDSIQVAGDERLGITVDLRFKADIPRRTGAGALRRVELVTDPPLEGLVEVRVGSSVKFVLRGPGYAELGRVTVVASVGPRRAGGTAVPADSQELVLHRATTTPRRLECGEASVMYDDINTSVGALDTRIFRLERPPFEPGLEWRRLRAKRDVALGLSGDLELRYPRVC